MKCESIFIFHLTFRKIAFSKIIRLTDIQAGRCINGQKYFCDFTIKTFKKVHFLSKEFSSDRLKIFYFINLVVICSYTYKTTFIWKFVSCVIVIDNSWHTRPLNVKKLFLASREHFFLETRVTNIRATKV